MIHKGYFDIGYMENWKVSEIKKEQFVIHIFPIFNTCTKEIYIIFRLLQIERTVSSLLKGMRSAFPQIELNANKWFSRKSN